MNSVINIFTAFGMAAIPLLVILWDVFLATNSQRTVSEIMLSSAREFVTIPVAWGVLAGHFFWWWTSPSLPIGTSRYYILAGIGIVVLVWDICMQIYPFPSGSWLWYLRYPAIWVVVGFLVGRYFFPQTSDFNFDYLRR